MSRDSKAILHRIDELLAIEFPNDDIQQRYVAVIEFYQGALILARAVYGDGSPRVHTLMMEAARTGRAPTDGS